MTTSRIGSRAVMRQRGTGDEAVLEIETWLSAQWRDPWRHSHPLQEERVSVRHGRLVAEIGGSSRIYSAGEAFIIPARVDHALSVSGAEGAHIVIEMTPPLRTAALMEHMQPAIDTFVNLARWSQALAAAIIVRDFAEELELVDPPLHLRPRIVGVLGTLARSLGYRTRIAQPGSGTRRLQKYSGWAASSLKNPTKNSRNNEKR